MMIMKMAVPMKMTVTLRMKVPLTALAFLATMLVAPASSEILYAESAPMSFEVWAADIKPGFVLKEKTINDRLCYCKNPAYSSSVSYISPLIGGSFSLNTPPPLTSSGAPGSSFEFVFLTPEAGDVQPEVGGLQPAITTSNTSGTVVVRTTTPACGNCNMDITFESSNPITQYEWASPHWYEGKNYPDGCTCKLTVNIVHANWAMYEYAFAAGSHIWAKENCVYDRMDVLLNGKTDRWCDTNLESKNAVVYLNGGGTYEYTFISDPGDGLATAKGFLLTVKVTYY